MMVLGPKDVDDGNGHADDENAEADVWPKCVVVVSAGVHLDGVVVFNDRICFLHAFSGRRHVVVIVQRIVVAISDCVKARDVGVHDCRLQDSRVQVNAADSMWQQRKACRTADEELEVIFREDQTKLVETSEVHGNAWRNRQNEVFV